jgi:hypothetical protein
LYFLSYGHTPRMEMYRLPRGGNLSRVEQDLELAAPLVPNRALARFIL